VVEYYKTYNPEKLSDVDVLLAYYGEREYDLWLALDQKDGTNLAAGYGQAPRAGERASVRACERASGRAGEGGG